jgi:hypothetical protein
MSRLDIADLAMEMLEHCEEKPGKCLLNLFQQLLDVDRHRRVLAEFPTEKFDLAVEVDAQLTLQGRVPSAYGLARRLSVSPSTIIAWRRLPEYQHKLQGLAFSWRCRLREFLDEVKVSGENISEQESIRRACELHNKEWERCDNLEFCFRVRDSLSSITDTKILKSIWKKEFAPSVESLTPSDRKTVLELFRKNKERLAR